MLVVLVVVVLVVVVVGGVLIDVFVPEAEQWFCLVYLYVAGWTRFAHLHMADDTRLANWGDNVRGASAAGHGAPW